MRSQCVKNSITSTGDSGQLTVFAIFLFVQPFHSTHITT